MKYEKIVTVYDTQEHAETARRNLELAGFSGSEISVVSNKTLASAGQTLREPGLWHRLFGGDIEQHEATVYGRTVESGGVVMTVRVPELDVPKAMGILDVHNVVDVQDRALEHGLLAPEDAKASVPKVAAASAAAAVTSTGGATREEVLRLAEEQLNVGKRLVEEGTTRIRRFVTERPVEEQISLHEEHAEVVRRAVANPSSLSDIDWSDKTVEVTETAERAVVSKSARVVEEVVIGKRGSDHVETVKDTVRRQQVEVERTQAAGASPKKP